MRHPEHLSELGSGTQGQRRQGQGCVGAHSEIWVSLIEKGSGAVAEASRQTGGSGHLRRSRPRAPIPAGAAADQPWAAALTPGVSSVS